MDIPTLIETIKYLSVEVTETQMALATANRQNVELQSKLAEHESKITPNEVPDEAGNWIKN